MDLMIVLVTITCLIAALACLGNSFTKEKTETDKALGKAFCLLYLLLALVSAKGGF